MKDSKNRQPLDRPVHKSLYEPTPEEQLRRRGTVKPHQYEQPARLGLSKPPNPEVTYKPTKSVSPTRKARLRAHLQVVYHSVPELPDEYTPPCGDCKEVPCCKAFVVHITQEEADSGLFDPHVVHITPDVRKQLGAKNVNSALIVINAGAAFTQEVGSDYFLDASVGQPCPFLTSDNQCGIYDIRPITCRMYSCIGDPRITRGMMDGSEDTGESMTSWALGLRAGDMDEGYEQ